MNDKASIVRLLFYTQLAMSVFLGCLIIHLYGQAQLTDAREALYRANKMHEMVASMLK